MRILGNHKWHPYKMQLLQHLSEDNPDGGVEFCEWVVDKMECDANFPPGFLLTGEANF
jgi:hypothetical protein